LAERCPRAWRAAPFWDVLRGTAAA
jgi:hypothetical protein